MYKDEEPTSGWADTHWHKTTIEQRIGNNKYKVGTKGG